MSYLLLPFKFIWRGIVKFRKAIYLLLALLIAINIAIPFLVMNEFTNIHVIHETTYVAEDFDLTSEKLVLKTEDGLNIVAHEVYTPNPNGVIILMSGIHNPSVTEFFGHSKMYQEEGYASILLELRAHGESEGDEIGQGFTEVLDVKALVNHIKSNDKYQDVPIIIQGLSMGGAVAINSFGQIPEIDGLISMSAYASWNDASFDTMVSMGLPKAIAYFQLPFMKLYTTGKYGLTSFNLTPKQQIKNTGNRPALIIHSSDDSQITISNFNKIMKNAPEHVETWVKDGDHHFICDDLLKPKDDVGYSTVVINFLNEHFGN